ncbi:MAG: ABC transporter permease [Candidatus Aminicenantes bacterium]|nr:ABC transporter permease [Candidatus Aminicenantes bacterium]
MNNKSQPCKNPSPPRPAIWLVKRMERYRINHAVLDDMREVFTYIYRERGLFFAGLWYWAQCFDAAFKNSLFNVKWRVIMFKNYIKMTMRQLKKHKGYSFINVFGLSVGMACCIFILLWVKDELSYDRFHTNADNIYRVTEHQYDSSGDYFPVAVTPWPLAEALKTDFPEIVESSRLRRLQGSLISHSDKKFYEPHLVAVDPSFLKMFSFPLVQGDISTALADPQTMLISEKTAAKYFGTEDPLGKVLTLYNLFDFKVTGVLKNVPQNSHITFDILIPFASSLRQFGWTDSWWTNNYTTYVQLTEDTPVQHISEKVADYLKKMNPRTTTKFILQPLTDIHLRSDYAIDLYGQTENKSIYVYAFSAIALFVLLIACINFMNLSTARSEKRAKEVGLRKVVGAVKSQITAQFYGESFFMTIISFFIAGLLVYLLLPVFNNISGKQLTLHSMGNPVILFILLGIMVVTGLISGSYPALVQSSFRPVEALRGIGTRTSSRSGKSLFRRVLVVTQFTLSIILIVGTLTVHRQINYMLNKELGYEKDSMMYFIKRAQLRTQYDAFKQELLRDPHITGVTTSSDVPTYSVHSTSAFTWEGKNPETHFLIHQFSVDDEYIKTFNMKLIAGRDFSKEFAADSSTQSFIVNEAAVKAMGLKNPVGTGFQLYDHKGQIVGVVRNFHYKSLQKEVEPLVLRIEPGRDSYVFIKFNQEHMKEAIDSVRCVYNKFNPEYPLEYTFLDEAVAGLYQSEQKTRYIFNAFTFFAILISCLGLYGLAAYMAQQKTKEIGVRKVLGASLWSIVSRMSKEFILLIGSANFIAWPLAYFAMNKWLHNFAYRINIDPVLFITAGLLSLFFGLFTVSTHTVKSARANTVDSLRYE